jgi:type IV secretion system protein TrbC
MQFRRVRMLAILLLFTRTAWAGVSTGLPWERPLTTVAMSLTGPVALAVSLIALAAAGATLVFGHELTDFARRACLLVLAIAFLVAGANIMTLLFGVAGAVI